MIEPRIYLASRSPRRRELLTQIGVRFDLLMFRGGTREDQEVSEDCLPGESPEAYVVRVARAKARFGADLLKRRPLVQHPVLAADTTLDVDGEIRHCVAHPGRGRDNRGAIEQPRTAAHPRRRRRAHPRRPTGAR